MYGNADTGIPVWVLVAILHAKQVPSLKYSANFESYYCCTVLLVLKIGTRIRQRRFVLASPRAHSQRATLLLQLVAFFSYPFPTLLCGMPLGTGK